MEPLAWIVFSLGTVMIVSTIIFKSIQRKKKLDRLKVHEPGVGLSVLFLVTTVALFWIIGLSESLSKIVKDEGPKT